MFGLFRKWVKGSSVRSEYRNQFLKILGGWISSENSKQRILNVCQNIDELYELCELSKMYKEYIFLQFFISMIFKRNSDYQKEGTIANVTKQSRFVHRQ